MAAYSAASKAHLVPRDAPAFLPGYPEASVDLRTGHVMIGLVQEGFDLAITQFPSVFY